MRVIFFLIILSIPNSIQSATRNCFSNHIKEAIILNKIRKPLYSKITNGKTKKISNLLIGFEKSILLISKSYDYRAEKFQRNEIPILCLDYVDIELTPNFSKVLNLPQTSYKDIATLNIKNIKRDLLQSLNNSFKELESLSEEIILENRNSGHYNCMVIHVLESIHRSAVLAPHYELSSVLLGTKSPRKLARKNIKLQINSLGIWYFLDKKAAKIQESGVSILCQDVPRIDPPTSDEIQSIYN